MGGAAFCLGGRHALRGQRRVLMGLPRYGPTLSDGGANQKSRAINWTTPVWSWRKHAEFSRARARVGDRSIAKG
jgi:hypothetical protein